MSAKRTKKNERKKSPQTQQILTEKNKKENQQQRNKTCFKSPPPIEFFSERGGEKTVSGRARRALRHFRNKKSCLFIEFYNFSFRYYNTEPNGRPRTHTHSESGSFFAASFSSEKKKQERKKTSIQYPLSFYTSSLCRSTCISVVVIAGLEVFSVSFC